MLNFNEFMIWLPGIVVLIWFIKFQIDQGAYDVLIFYFYFAVFLILLFLWYRYWIKRSIVKNQLKFRNFEWITLK